MCQKGTIKTTAQKYLGCKNWIEYEFMNIMSTFFGWKMTIWPACYTEKNQYTDLWRYLQAYWTAIFAIQYNSGHMKLLLLLLS